MASAKAFLSVGSTLKASAMQLTATSTESWSSAERVPSVTEVVKKSQMASARRCLEGEDYMYTILSAAALQQKGITWASRTISMSVYRFKLQKKQRLAEAGMGDEVVDDRGKTNFVPRRKWAATMRGG